MGRELRDGRAGRSRVHIPDRGLEPSGSPVTSHVHHVTLSRSLLSHAHSEPGLSLASGCSPVPPPSSLPGPTPAPSHSLPLLLFTSLYTPACRGRIHLVDVPHFGAHSAARGRCPVAVAPQNLPCQKSSLESAPSFRHTRPYLDDR